MAVITQDYGDDGQKPCPDCRYHKVSDHDMFGCTFQYCGCLLTQEFLRDYYEEL